MRAKFIRGQKPLDAMGIGIAKNLSIETSDAYSFDRYGMDEWRAIATFMISQGVSEEVAAWVLRSKHMRWAADRMPEFDEGIGAEGFEHYWERNENDILKNISDPNILNK